MSVGNKEKPDVRRSPRVLLRQQKVRYSTLSFFVGSNTISVEHRLSTITGSLPLRSRSLRRYVLVCDFLGRPTPTATIMYADEERSPLDGHPSPNREGWSRARRMSRPTRFPQYYRAAAEYESLPTLTIHPIIGPKRSTPVICIL